MNAGNNTLYTNRYATNTPRLLCLRSYIEIDFNHPPETCFENFVKYVCIVKYRYYIYVQRCAVYGVYSGNKLKISVAKCECGECDSAV